MKTLNPQVAAKYLLIGLRPGKYAFKNFGEIDLCSLTLARADDLVKRGFPHFRLRDVSAETETTGPVNLKARSLKAEMTAKVDAEINKVDGNFTETFRNNKQYVNKLLTLDWKDLTHQDRLIFFNLEKYFLEKKMILLEISSLDREMKSLHAKVRLMAKDGNKQDQLQSTMESIASMEEDKVAAWQKIDIWSNPFNQDTEKISKEAAEKAIERDKLIKAHGNYIYRAELALPNMPEKTSAEKKRKAEKQAEVDRRKEDLIKLGAPYDRKSRK